MSDFPDFESYGDDQDDVNRDLTGKIVLAALAGAAAGAVIGLLLAPNKGSATVANLKTAAGRYGEHLEGTLKKYVEKIEEMGLTGAGSSLSLKGEWNDLKGQLKAQYADLTDEDLTYLDGKEDQLIGSIQRKLGKTKKEVVRLLNDLG